MTSLSLFTGGQLLRAAAAPGTPDDRIREGILVPWNEPGRTNLGHGVQVLRAALSYGDKVVGIYGHNREAAVSRVIQTEDRPAGLWGRIRVGRGALGDQLLAEIDDGVRDGLSVEASDLQFDAAGNIVAGRLDYVAHVPVGAYNSARIAAPALAATVPQTGATVTLPLQPAAPAAPAAPALGLATAPALAAQAPAAQAPAAQAPAAQAPAAQPLPAQAAQPAQPAAPAGADPVQLLLAALGQFQTAQGAAAVAAPAPAASAATLLPTGGLPSAQAVLNGDVDPLAEAARLSAELHRSGGRDRNLLAALQDITASGLPLFQEEASRLGNKLWEGTKDTSRPFVDLMAQAPLTSMRYYGWQWTQLPEMQEWAGDKTPISGNPVNLEQVPFDAKRCAAGWDVDRKYKDFGDAEFWREFYTEQTRAYRRLSNTWAAQALVAAALDVTTAANYADAATPGPLPTDAKGLVPATGVPEGATQILKAVAIGNVILENTPRVEQTADYVLVNAYDWLRLTDLASLDLPAFLALLKVNPDRFRPTTKVPANHVVMGCVGAMTYRELPGTEGKGSPIRVEALDVARGGVDSAVFGYVGIANERPGGVISVPLDDPDGTVG